MLSPIIIYNNTEESQARSQKGRVDLWLLYKYFYCAADEKTTESLHSYEATLNF